jgi:hypothetical protein
LEIINGIKQLTDNQYDLSRKALEALQQHYKTGDEDALREYKKMLERAQAIKAEWQLKFNSLLLE